ncbi:hypothetical protein [Streptomyces sp. NPDC042319]|uniref:hypothetical protein n=1 Tax=Streptomyces sp. NPDC042319 TaxID=3154332 RepID=UPI0034073BCA
MFGRSKNSDDGRVIKHDSKSTSEATRSTRFRKSHQLSGRYEARCEEHGFTVNGLPTRGDAETALNCHDHEQH